MTRWRTLLALGLILSLASACQYRLVTPKARKVGAIKVDPQIEWRAISRSRRATSCAD